MKYSQKVKETAKGQWVFILESLGMELPKRNRHGPCPGCEGRDRFRFDYEDERFYCSQGTGVVISGDGFDLIRHVFGWGFPKTLGTVADILGVEREKPEKSGEHFYHNRHWREFKPVARAMLILEIMEGDLKRGKKLSKGDEASCLQAAGIISDFLKKGGLIVERQKAIQEFIELIKEWDRKVRRSIVGGKIMPIWAVKPPRAALLVVKQYIDDGGEIKDNDYEHQWFVNLVNRHLEDDEK